LTLGKKKKRGWKEYLGKKKTGKANQKEWRKGNWLKTKQDQQHKKREKKKKEGLANKVGRKAV